MSDTCGCCTGLAGQTPVAIANRPGLSALAYRVGNHGTLFARMIARLSSKDYPALAALRTRDPSDPAIALLDAWATVADILTFYQERIGNEGYLRTATERRSILELARLVGYELRPGVAASTFLAYLLEKDHEVEIPAGSRVQSVPGPGELPQTFETADPLKARAAWNNLQPRMTRPQRITLPIKGQPLLTDAKTIEVVYFEGTATKLQLNDALLFVFGDGDDQQLLRLVGNVAADFDAKRTAVTLLPIVPQADKTFVATLATLVAGFLADARLQQAARQPAGRLVTMLTGLQAGIVAGVPAGQIAEQVNGRVEELAKLAKRPAIPKALTALISDIKNALADAITTFASNTVSGAGRKTVQATEQPTLESMLSRLSAAHSITPASKFALARSATDTFVKNGDTAPKLLVALRPYLAPLLYPALAGATVTPGAGLKVYALRVTASLYGSNAPRRPVFAAEDRGKVIGFQEWKVLDDQGNPLERVAALDLAGTYDQIIPGTWVVVITPSGTIAEPGPIIALADKVDASLSRGDYGISGKITRVTLSRNWLTKLPDGTSDFDDFREIRETRVHAQAEELVLAQQPITDPICDDEVELSTVYDGLEAGRWIIVAGERADIPGVTGVEDAELAMLAGVSQSFDETLPGDRVHTKLSLADGGLASCYKRASLIIYGNVVKATHGETKSELLGSGDAAVPGQSFSLKASPLTYVAAPTATGAASTLNLRVNDVLWHEVEVLAEAGPTDHVYATRTDDADETTALFGDGRRGARLPTGTGNVKAKYRTGIGKPGNVRAGKLTLLATKPLGVKEVVNPIRASGGADRDSRDQARRNVPVALQALDRLVSLQDYADFARSFAGIGKASAQRLSDSGRQVVHVTIAGADDIPIDPSSDLYRNLLAAFHDLGDPFQPVLLAMRSLLLLIMSAGVALRSDYAWDSVEPRVRAAVLEGFGFDRRDLGQNVYLSEVLGAIQAVDGVAYVDVDTFDGVSETIDLGTLLGGLAGTLGKNDYVAARLAATGATPGDPITPAQLAIFDPNVPETLLLHELI